MARGTITEEILKKSRLMADVHELYRRYVWGEFLDRLVCDRDFSRASLAAAFQQCYGPGWSTARKRQRPGSNFRRNGGGGGAGGTFDLGSAG